MKVIKSFGTEVLDAKAAKRNMNTHIAPRNILKTLVIVIGIPFLTGPAVSSSHAEIASSPLCTTKALTKVSTQVTKLRDKCVASKRAYETKWGRYVVGNFSAISPKHPSMVLFEQKAKAVQQRYGSSKISACLNGSKDVCDGLTNSEISNLMKVSPIDGGRILESMRLLTSAEAASASSQGSCIRETQERTYYNWLRAACQNRD